MGYPEARLDFTCEAVLLRPEILVSSVLRSHGFTVSHATLSIRTDRRVRIDFHPPNTLLYAELDVESGYAYNLNINVNPRYRHRGVGSRLVAAYEEICREEKLTIVVNNNQNPEFWRRKGYRRLNPFQRMRLSRLGIECRRQSVYKRPAIGSS
jgi:ribosomal protein S18 acetylase RimI-like enzyme